MPIGDWHNNKIKVQVPSHRQKTSLKNLSHSMLVFNRFCILKCIMPEFHAKESWIIFQVQLKRFSITKNEKQILNHLSNPGTVKYLAQQDSIAFISILEPPYSAPLCPPKYSGTQSFPAFYRQVQSWQQHPKILSDTLQWKWPYGPSTDVDRQMSERSSFIKSRKQESAGVGVNWEPLLRLNG